MEAIIRKLDQAQRQWCMQAEGLNFQLWRSYSWFRCKWIKGYTKKIVACDALYVDMWELYLFVYRHGLKGAF